ncbi:MAG: hypothetical protein Tsb0034_21440 [Ekhidna sp.]
MLPIIIAAGALALFLYRKEKVPWNTWQNRTLFSLRFIAILLLLSLLLEPQIKRIVNTVKNPVIAIAVDNSESVTARGDSTPYVVNQIADLKEKLEAQGKEVHLFTLGENDSLVFNQKTSRLSELFSKIEEQLADEDNHVGTVLITDGLYNRGSSPLYKNYLRPVYTVGLGDTLAPKDISISRVRYNRVAFKGNKSPIQVELSQSGYEERSVTISLYEGGNVIDSKQIRLEKDLHEVGFEIDLEEEGLKHLSTTVSILPDETTTENNRVEVFMEVIDGRQKVLVVAHSPHPDIKAIRLALEETDNYVTDLYIPSMHDEKPREIYDVIIHHGAFSSSATFSPKGNPGVWYILSGESAINIANRELPFLNIERRGGQPDLVSGSFNQNFSKFSIENPSAFEDFPPLEVPFGEYALTGPTEVLMFQKLGNVITNKPLMAVFDDGSTKSAVLVGQNIWKWKMQEAAITDASVSFQNFVTKTVQFLSVKNDKKQFRFKPRNSTFPDSSPILFDTEVYNDIYERIYGNNIRITITDEAGDQKNYEFVDAQANQTFRAPMLTPGIYQYAASTQIGNDSYTESGEFLVENINPEYLNLTADHRLLRNLALKSGGQFVPFDGISQLPQIIEEANFKPTIHSQESFEQLVKSWWWYFIIFLLFSTEWFLRRYWGGY